MRQRQIEQAWQGPPQCEACGIRDLVLFADLKREDFALIHQPIDELDRDHGTQLYRVGDAPRYVYTVREGSIKLVHYAPDGGYRIVRLMTQGDVVGLEALPGQPYEHDAVVLEDARLCRIPVSVIERLNRDTPRLYRQLMARWQRSVHDADAWLTALSQGPAAIRVARLLLTLAERGGPTRIYLPSREDIGAMLGMTPETASRVTAELRREGILREHDPRHAGIDLERLRARID